MERDFLTVREYDPNVNLNLQRAIINGVFFGTVEIGIQEYQMKALCEYLDRYLSK